MAATLAVWWDADPSKRVKAEISVPSGRAADLARAVREAFRPHLDRQEFCLTDGSTNITSDADVSRLSNGDSLMVVLRSGGDAKPQAKERVCFPPHPKTLTMAGDYEYFAAQGHHPFAFALAELIDNALRATKRNVDRPREIKISFVVGDGSRERGGGGDTVGGLVCVQDSGGGMSKRELNDWAVMNLSMEDRGLLDVEALAAAEPAGGRYLSGDLSYFGVGSKNACFFMGRSVKVATKQAGSHYVHELCIRAAELERRYRDGQSVYEEEMVHRLPGDASTRCGQEATFDITAAWVAAEEAKPAAAAAAAGAAAASDSSAGAGAAAGAGPSFTRVLISDLKHDVLGQIRSEDAGLKVCNDLAHLYHYYLHGPRGNVASSAAAASSKAAAAAGTGAAAASSSSMLPGGERTPRIVVEYVSGRRLVWRKELAQVEDDMESRYLRAARSTFDFSVSVPGRGVVEGVLWYFPYEHDHETVPCSGSLLDRGAGTAGGGAYHATQMPSDAATQHHTLAQALATARPGGGGVLTQHPAGVKHHTVLDLAAGEDDDDAGGSGAAAAAARALAAPIFETFWQGRLIPASVVDSLPFIEAVRTKHRTAAARDALPDDVFGRIRGALFFGPSFLVTRNKLTFRDNLPSLLAGSVPSDRNAEKRLKEWLTECHRSFDRIIRFERLAPAAAQAAARRELGEQTTVFERISDGFRVVVKGDHVRLSTKPALVGEVLHFSVPSVVREDGCYAQGHVTVRPVPAEVFGPEGRVTLPLRRIEESLSAQQLVDHTAKELLKLPASLKLEPLKYGSAAAGAPVLLTSGDTIPDTSVTVFNGLHQKISRTHMAGGAKTALRVVQRLWYDGPEQQQQQQAAAAELQTGATGAAAATNATTCDDGAAAGSPSKPKPSKRRRVKGGGEDVAAAAAAAAPQEAGTAAAAVAATGKENAPPADGAADKGAADNRASSSSRAGKSSGKGSRKSASAAAAAAAAAGVPQGELVLEVENRTPIHDVFQFSKISCGLQKAGMYRLTYSLLPEVPGREAVQLVSVLRVAAGAPARFELQGEGRAAACSGQLLLGQPLPPITLVMYDSLGNAVPLPAECEAAVIGAAAAGSAGAEAAKQQDAAAASFSDLKLELLSTSGMEGSAPAAPVEELHVESRVSASAGSLVIERLCVVGPDKPASGGLAVFRAAAGTFQEQVGSIEQQQAQRSASQVARPPPVLELQLMVRLGRLVPQALTLRVRPGAPHSLALLPGHPFNDCLAGCEPSQQQQEGAPQEQQPMALTQLPRDAGLPPAHVVNGEALPPFQVALRDWWGNPTAPCAGLDCKLQLDCDVLQPAAAAAAVDFDAAGVAAVKGLRVVSDGGRHVNQRTDLRICLKTSGSSPGLQAAAEWGGPTQELHAAVVVKPCTLPSSLVLLHQGQELKLSPGPEGPVAQLAGVTAGASLEALALRFLDEGGRPAAPGLRGRLQVSWAKGGKKVATPGEEGELPLPRLEAQQHCGPPQAHWLRFTGEGPSASAISLELSFEVHVVAGPPSAWSVSIVDGSGNSQAAAAQQQHHDGGGGGGGGPNADAASGDLSHIQCGKPFFLEIEAVDQYNNRCGCDCFDGPLPTPRVLPQAEAPPEDGVSGLVYDPSTWQQGWDMSQPRGPVFVVRLSLGGTAAPVKLMVRDECGPSGGTSLCEDCLPLELSPGPAAMLAFEGPNQLACGTRGLLGELHVRACDAFGNVVEAAGFEVLLQPAAIATDGSGHAAKVNAAGTNRVKLKRGVAVLRDVRINAEQAATYAVRVASATRKVVVADGQLLVAVAAQNYVTALALLPGGLPAAAAGADGAAGAPTRHVGSSLSLVAQVTTEDGEPLPYDVAAAGMTLRLTFPNTTGGSGGGDRIESVALSPECGKESCPAPNLFVFSTAQLTLSGTYTVTLVYVESRQELARTMPKQEQSVRSTSHALEVLPGRAAQLTLEGPSADASHVAVTNGPNDKARCLLRGAAVQVRDAWGNACPLEGMPVRWALLPRPTAATTSGGSKQQQQQPLLNGEMPVLACAEEASSLQANTDSRGRAYFGDLVVKEGSGRVDAPPPGSTSNIMLLELRLEAQGLGAPAAAAASKKASATGAAGSWGKAWSVTVAFSDDAARAGALQALMQQKDELRSQGRALKEHRAAAEKAADVARRDHKRLIKHAEKCAGELPTALRERFEALGGVAAAGGGAKLAAQLLDNVKGKAATGASSQPSRPHVVPRYGKPNTPSANAIQRCLTSGDPHVVGVFAELGQIDDPLLNQQLSSCVQGSLSTLVTSSFECIERLRAALQAANMYIPSMLSTTHINPFTPTGYPGDQTMRGRTALATKLAADACDGSDPPVLLPLPHTGALAAMDAGRRANVPRGAGPAQDEWPAGCLGFAVNLVRPVVRGHRSTVFLSLLGRCVIFETMSQAAAYRTYVTQVLGSGSIGDLYTLDGRRMSGRGVISGSNHRVYELEDAPCRFGSVPAGQSAATQALTQQAQGLEALAEALAAKEAADCALAAAEKALEGAQAAYERGQQQLRAESERLKAEIEAMQGGGGGGAASAELEQQQQQPAAKAAGGGSKRRRSEVLAADAPPPAGTDGADAEAAAVAEEEETAAADGGGKSRKAQRRTGAAPGGGGNSKRMGAMQG